MTRELYDIGGEQRVIAGALRYPDTIGRLSEIVSPDDMVDKRHVIIWRCLTGMDRPGSAADLAEALHASGRLNDVGGPAYIGEIVDAGALTVGAERRAANVAELARIRRLRDMLTGLHAAAADPGQSAQAYADRVMAAVLEATRGQEQTGARGIRDILRDVLTDLDAARRGEGGCIGVPLPWQGLTDALIGLEAGRMYVVAARPGMGKSVVGWQIAVHAARLGTPAVVYSLEMSDYQLACRLLAAEGGVPLGAIRTRQLEGGRFEAIGAAVQRVKGWPLTVDDTPALTVQQVRARSRRLAAQGRCGIVVVDYLQIMGSSVRRGGSREQDVSEMSRGLKSLAKELAVPVIALSQLNRSLEQRGDRRPILSDLRESGSIEQDADAVIMLYRPAMYAQEGSADADDPTIEAIIRKQRDGRTGTVGLRFDGRHVRILG